MPQPKPWLDEIIEALTELGGIAPYARLYAHVEKRDVMDFELNQHWQEKIRGTIQNYSSDSKTYKTGRPNLFFSVDGIGKGTWGLVSMVPPNPVPSDNLPAVIEAINTSTKVPQSAQQVKVSTYRYIRDTKLARTLKASYENKCQICGAQISTAGQGPYSEAHHIQPLNQDGPDVRENLVVLCPNHHAEFDYGGLAVEPGTHKVIHSDKSNYFHNKAIHVNHHLDDVYLTFHLERIFGQPKSLSDDSQKSFKQ
jgi:hypothetical protein